MSGSNATAPPAIPPLSELLPGFNLNETLGAAYIGLVLSAVLYGITVVQCLHYFEHSPKDYGFMKFVVGLLMAIGTFDQLCVAHMMYTYLVTDFANPVAIFLPTWSLDTTILTSTIGNCIVQLCYAYRLWIISKRNALLAIPPASATLISTTFGCVIAGKAYGFTSVFQLSSITWLFYSSFSLAIFSDVWIALMMCYFLAKSRTGFQSTDKIIAVLTAYIINTGLLTSVCAILILVTFAAKPTAYIYLAFFMIYPKLFYNALLAMLNARGRLSFSPKASTGGGSSFHDGSNPSRGQMYRLPQLRSGGNATNTLDGATAFTTSAFSHADGNKKDYHITVNVERETDYLADDTDGDGDSSMGKQIHPLQP